MVAGGVKSSGGLDCYGQEVFKNKHLLQFLRFAYMCRPQRPSKSIPAPSLTAMQNDWSTVVWVLILAPSSG